MPGCPGRAIRLGGFGGAALLDEALPGVGLTVGPKEKASGVGKAGARSGRRSGRDCAVGALSGRGSVRDGGRVSPGAGAAGTGGGRGMTMASDCGAGGVGSGAASGGTGGMGNSVAVGAGEVGAGVGGAGVGGAGGGRASVAMRGGSGGAGAGCASIVTWGGGGGGGRAKAVRDSTAGGAGGAATLGAGEPGRDDLSRSGFGPDLRSGECPSNTMAKSAGATSSGWEDRRCMVNTSKTRRLRCSASETVSFGPSGRARPPDTAIGDRPGEPAGNRTSLCV